jgi:hypothetical protein
MDVAASLIADRQAPERVEPGQCALDHQTDAAQTLARLDPAASGHSTIRTTHDRQ